MLFQTLLVGALAALSCYAAPSRQGPDSEHHLARRGRVETEKNIMPQVAGVLDNFGVEGREALGPQGAPESAAGEVLVAETKKDNDKDDSSISNTACFFNITFNLTTPPPVGNLWLLGNSTDAGEWEFIVALKGKADSQTADVHQYEWKIEIPPGVELEYHYAQKEGENKVPVYEKGWRKISTPSCEQDGPMEGVVNDRWKED